MMLNVQGLRTGYGRIPILNGIGFAVNEGEFIGILGHNGMGKTTLLRALMGFLPANSGRVHLAGADVTALEPYRRARLGLGYVPQGREIFPGLTVHDNLRMGCSTQGSSSEQDTIGEVLEEFPRLEPLLDRAGSALSGGEQQLLAIARCLCGNPRLILLDEPAAGMTHEEVHKTAELVREINRTKALIVVEHDMQFIRMIAKQVTVFNQGSVLVEDTVESIMRNPQVRDIYLGKQAAA